MYVRKSCFKYIGNRQCEQFLCSLTHFKKWEKEHLFRLDSLIFIASKFIFKSTSKAVALFVLNYIKLNLQFKHYSRMKLFIEEISKSRISL